VNRILFVNRFYFPDESASSLMLTDLATSLAARGHEVRVLTSRQLHNQATTTLPGHECINGVDIHRVATTGFGRSNLPGRALDYLSFYVTAFLWLLGNLKARDLCVVKTDPPLLSVPASWAVRLKGARLINWLQDIYPETAARLGLIAPEGLLARLLRSLRDASLRRAQVNVVIGQTMKKWLMARHLPDERIAVISNWADGQAIHPLVYENNPLRRQWFADDEFVIGYSGNMGRAHDLDLVLNAAEILERQAVIDPQVADAKIRFLFVGSGHQKADLESAARQRDLSHVHFQPFQPRSQLNFSLNAADVHIASLKPELEGLILPSKFYGALATGKPIIFIGDLKGEISQWLKTAECGFSVAPFDTEALVGKLLNYANNPALCRQHGANARSLFDEHFSKDGVCEQWHNLLRNLD
jgi:colanic acid biosynthesis glycosyl transferase WcaI